MASLTARGSSEAYGPVAGASVLAYDRLIFDPFLRQYYGESLAYNVGLWSGGAGTQAEASRDLIADLLARVTRSPSRILDVACGLGETTRRICERWPDADVLGINFSAAQVAACRTHTPHCRFEVMDATHLAFEADSFDAIVCVEAAMHFRTRRDFLGEALRVLRPGGQMVLTDMLFASETWLEAWHVPVDNDIRGVAAYAAALREAGFMEIHVEDRRDECWGGFCRGVRTWVDDPSNPARDSAAAEPWRQGLDALEQAIGQYVLASMSKPR